MSSKSRGKRRREATPPSSLAGPAGSAAPIQPAALVESVEPAPRFKRFNVGTTRPNTRDEFEIAIICALTHEVDAVEALLDNRWDGHGQDGYGKDARDPYSYTCGRIGRHNVVVPHMAGMGKVRAAAVAANCKLSFPRVKLALVVGVCAAVPFVRVGLGQEREIILGDVVISQGLVQNDFGRQTDAGLSTKVTPLESLGRPITEIASHVAKLESRDGRKSLLRDMLKYLEVLQGDLDLEAGYLGVEQDWLFEPTYLHDNPNDKCEDLCDRSKLMPRDRLRGPGPPTPAVHFGLIASGDQVIKSAMYRDKAVRDHNVVAFEMEAAGVWDIIPCVVIKGVCDYADSHKAKSWQKRAAAVAAACMKAFLRNWTPLRRDEQPSYCRKSQDAVFRSQSSSPEPSIFDNQLQGTPLPPETPGCREDSSAHDEIDAALKQSLVDGLFFSKIDERLTSLAAAQHETCRWFFAKPEFTAWRGKTQQPGDSDFLWIKGHPGTGKSTLMKLLFEEARNDARGEPSQITISFFFLARGTIEEKSTMGLYRSLLYQLFEKAEDLKDSLQCITALGARGIIQNGWHEAALKQTLTHAIQSLGSRSLAIFVDALDECDQSQAGGMVCFFEELCDRARDANVNLQICFSSRHYPTIVIEKGVEVILEAEDGHTNDIKRYIKSKLRLGKNNKHAETLRDEILQKSSGIFLWVVLVLDIIRQEFPVKCPPVNQIRNRLKQIPPGLHDLFKMIISRDANNLEQLDFCLQLVLFAARPLKPQELYFAIRLGLGEDISGYWDHEAVEEDHMKDLVRTTSKGLAEVTRNKASEVQFIHESVRDFLLRGRYGAQWSGALGVEGHCHKLLKDCCLAQLNANIHQSIGIPDAPPRGAEAKQLRENIRERFPFLEYSVFNVLHHANSAQRHGSDQRDLLTDFPLPQWVTFNNNFFERHEIRRYTKSVNLLYIFAEKNLSELIRIHHQPAACFDVGDERYGPPIFAAVATGSHDAVEAILKSLQARVQHLVPPFNNLWAMHRQNAAKKTRMTPTFKFSPQKGIFWHLREPGDEAILLAYLFSGQFEVDAKDQDFRRTPLSWAAVNGHEGIVKLLLKTGNVDLDSKDVDGDTPLSLAAMKGHEVIAKLLLETGRVEVDSKDSSGWTPLSLAAQNGHENIVKLLFETGRVDVDPKDHLGWTPLSAAARNGHAPVIKLLLKTGRVDVNSKDKDGKTPLFHAAIFGHEAVAKLLLENRVDINSKNKTGETPLLLAARCGHEAVVKLFLETGRVDINSKDEDGQTPLSWAARNGHTPLVRLLLETGRVDIETKDNFGRTPLWWATRRSTGTPLL